MECKRIAATKKELRVISVHMKRNVVRPIPTGKPIKLASLASHISGIKTTKVPKKKGRLGTKNTKTASGTRTHPNRQKQNLLPAAKKLRLIDATAKVIQAGHLTTKPESNGRRNLKLRRGCP